MYVILRAVHTANHDPYTVNLSFFTSCDIKFWWPTLTKNSRVWAFSECHSIFTKSISLAWSIGPQCHANASWQGVHKACNFGGTQWSIHPLYTHELRTVYTLRGQKWTALTRNSTTCLRICYVLFPCCSRLPYAMSAVPRITAHCPDDFAHIYVWCRGYFWSRFGTHDGTLGVFDDTLYWVSRFHTYFCTPHCSHTLHARSRRL